MDSDEVLAVDVSRLSLENRQRNRQTEAIMARGGRRSTSFRPGRSGNHGGRPERPHPIEAKKVIADVKVEALRQQGATERKSRTCGSDFNSTAGTNANMYSNWKVRAAVKRILLAIAAIMLGARAMGAFVTFGLTYSFYPLQIRGGVLETAQGKPFLMVGDTPQSLIGNVLPCSGGTHTYAACSVSTDSIAGGKATMVAYMRNAQQSGFNTLMVIPLCDRYTPCANGTSTTPDGINPFTGYIRGCSDRTAVECYDLTTPNEAYFARIDLMVELAAQFGLVVMLNVPESGACLSSYWQQTFLNNGTSNVTTFGTYFGSRYGKFANVIMEWADDYTCWQTAADDDLVYAFMGAFHAAAPNVLTTSELAMDVSSSLDDTTNNWVSGKAPLNLNGLYTYYPPYLEVYHAIGQSSSLPIYMEETNYIGDNDTGWDADSPLRERKQEWWTLTSGAAAGGLWGNKVTVNFVAGWNTASNLNPVQVTQMNYMAEFVALKMPNWPSLVPDTCSSHNLVTAGYGTCATSPCQSGPQCQTQPASGSTIDQNFYVTSEVNAAGTLGVVYFPDNSTTVTMAMSKFAGSVTAVWYDPTADPTQAGSYTTATGSPFSNTGTQTFTSPFTHTDGAHDAVLLLSAP